MTARQNSPTAKGRAGWVTSFPGLSGHLEKDALWFHLPLAGKAEVVEVAGNKEGEQACCSGRALMGQSDLLCRLVQHSHGSPADFASICLTPQLLIFADTSLPSPCLLLPCSLCCWSLGTAPAQISGYVSKRRQPRQSWLTSPAGCTLRTSPSSCAPAHHTACLMPLRASTMCTCPVGGWKPGQAHQQPGPCRYLWAQIRPCILSLACTTNQAPLQLALPGVYPGRTSSPGSPLQCTCWGRGRP